MRFPLTLCLLFASACSKPTPKAPEIKILSAVSFGEPERKEAREVYDSLCASCHGATGKGDGADGKTKVHEPRSFADAKWLAEVTDEQLARTIVLGGEAQGLSDEMRAFPDLLRDRPVLAALIAHLRSFAR